MNVEHEAHYATFLAMPHSPVHLLLHIASSLIWVQEVLHLLGEKGRGVGFRVDSQTLAHYDDRKSFLGGREPFVINVRVEGSTAIEARSAYATLVAD